MTDETSADDIARAAKIVDTSQPLTFVAIVDYRDCYRRGTDEDALLLVPGLWSGMPAELLEATRARRRCSATGRCPECGAAANLAEAAIDHEPDCPINSENYEPMLDRWTSKVGHFARGRRLREDPS